MSAPTVVCGSTGLRHAGAGRGRALRSSRGLSCTVGRVPVVGLRGHHFCFAQIHNLGPRRKEIGASIVATSRSTRRLRGALVQIAEVARQIVAGYQRFDTDEPWGFADPSGWKCSARYCDAGRCPGSAGLRGAG